MMLFQRRIFRELFWNTVTTWFLLTAVLVLILSSQAVVRTEGLTLMMFARSIPVFATTEMNLTLPISVLVAVILTYGRAAADNEIDTLRASGVHPLHVFMPGLVFGVFISAGMLVTLDYVRPLMERSKKRMAKDTDLAALLRNKLAAGEPVKLDDETIISVDGFDAEGRAQGMRIQIYNTDEELEREIVAVSASLRLKRETGEFEVTMYDFEGVVGGKIRGEQVTITRPLPRDVALMIEKHLTTPQLMAWLDRHPTRRTGFTETFARLDVHMRMSGAVSCLLFVILGIPVALMFKRHDRTGAFLVAFLLTLFVYFPAKRISFELARGDLLSPFVASWTGSLFMLALGLGLCWRVVRR
ncbi:MAG: LptF/LptG family permease [Planctomycetota bacterium]